MNIFSSISMIKYVGRVFGCVELSTSKLFYEYKHPYDVEFNRYGIIANYMLLGTIFPEHLFQIKKAVQSC